MSNTTLSTKLASFINGQMTDFLNQVAEKHDIDASVLLSEWESYTGLKPKTKKTVVKGPTMKELREKLKGVNLPVSGKKQDLIDRLADFESGKLKPKALDTASAIAAGDYSVMNVKMLKEKLKEKGLKLSGKKSELVKRLTESDNETESYSDEEEEGPNYKSYTVKKLRGELKARGIKVKTGDKKEDLIKYLEDDDKHMDDSGSESESESESEDSESEDEEETGGSFYSSDGIVTNSQGVKVHVESVE
tara:strand:+ start:634 stop:1377 length:744 start_codon:yes stop_codon:yes gene_type:complete